MSGNPFRPGAGHTPPYLAGREQERNSFGKLLKQDIILENVVLTGLRGVGKTVLLDQFKQMAITDGWAWVGSDLSETVSVSEENLATRLLTDLAPYTATVKAGRSETQQIGFNAPGGMTEFGLTYQTLRRIYEETPGLVADKIKSVLRLTHQYMPEGKKLIFAYDEAQNLADNAAKDEFPLSVLLEVFQAIQREGIPFMLILTGLPTLFPKLVEARTYAERMFTVLFLDRLNQDESRQAIEIPLRSSDPPIRPTNNSIESICEISGGYPYFIQFICREAYDIWQEDSSASILMDALIQKLDTDFFSGRWHRASDRQQDLMCTIARLQTSGAEFAVQEIVSESKKYQGSFSASHINQMLAKLADKGLVYKNRHGKYSFAVPMLRDFINRQPSTLIEKRA